MEQGNVSEMGAFVSSNNFQSTVCFFSHIVDNNFRYLLEGINYNRNLFAGPPRAVSDDDMKNLFGDWAEYVLLKESSPDCELIATKELAKYGEKAEQTLYLITPRV